VYRRWLGEVCSLHERTGSRADTGIVRCANGLAEELMLGCSLREWALRGVSFAWRMHALKLGVFAARTGVERGFVRLIRWGGSDTPLQATDKGRQSPRPWNTGHGLRDSRIAVP